jgi:hypothetical protein
MVKKYIQKMAGVFVLGPDFFYANIPRNAIGRSRCKNG